MLKINGKTFMNIQEAVQWLLDNNALPFQSTANYVANTEIGLGTIVNPSPAKVRIGSLIFFADSKVSTVTGLTENGFIVSDQYNNLVDDIAYVTNVAINASGHLITTLSDGQTIDAGQIKQVSGFSIDGSQHLIVSFNDGTSTDLGAIFSGNVNIAGNLTADSIIENMSGYSATMGSESGWTFEKIYISACKNGNKLTFVCAINVTKTDGSASNNLQICDFTIPVTVGSRLYPTDVGGINFLDLQTDKAYESYSDTKNVLKYWRKASSTSINCTVLFNEAPVVNTKYYVRCEATFLLSDDIA